MKILVAYWSQTGNTRKIAEVIFGSLPFEKMLMPFDDVDTLDGFDLTFIGFPIMQFGPPPAAKKFIADHATGKQIALFITHATPSASYDPLQQNMLKKELNKCISICSGAHLAGMFHCQGELAAKTADELHLSDIPMLMEFAAMRPATLGHPDPEEMRQAAAFANKIINGLVYQIP